MTCPPNGSTYQSGTPITITATAGDSDGTVSKVNFYNGATLIGTVATAPYSFTWTTAPIGNLTLTAVATDNGGAARHHSHGVTTTVALVSCHLGRQ